ncbi:lipopolysaccharide heptosyltransferase family protein [Vibrio sp. T187]|uniref:glycosyltransferase family 9 protein n=1 Tax=Vibrio TaxID=662 RepID=UPI0010C964DF|nr:MULTISPECIES: glycosyltransferase family 9 protein [Vibrio]MBW3697604.1 lipopolysaccharide heptosyltransferase family protein [Vibrio sp. T187]
MSLFKSAPKSLCILRLSAIGDVCNSIAAVQSIQQYWPQTKITWITGKLESQLLQSIDNVEVIVFDKKAGIKGYIQLWKSLKGRKFDALLHMQYALRASVATLGINAEYKLGFDAKRCQDFQNFFTNTKVESPTTMHVLDGLMAFAHTLGVPKIHPTWALNCTEADKIWAQEQLSNSNKNLVIVPAASKGYKNWTRQGYVDVIEHAHLSGWHVTLAGSPAKIEVELAQDIEKSLSSPCQNLVGKSNLLQMLALIDKATIVIAPDTGPTHMANAMRTPIIGLYAHHNPERTGPYNYQEYVVSAYQEAIKAEHDKSPEQLPWRTRVKDPLAMQRISSKQVIEMFERVVKEL